MRRLSGTPTHRQTCHVPTCIRNTFLSEVSTLKMYCEEELFYSKSAWHQWNESECQNMSKIVRQLQLFQISKSLTALADCWHRDAKDQLVVSQFLHLSLELVGAAAKYLHRGRHGQKEDSDVVGPLLVTQTSHKVRSSNNRRYNPQNFLGASQNSKSSANLLKQYKQEVGLLKLSNERLFSS